MRRWASCTLADASGVLGAKPGADALACWDAPPHLHLRSGAGIDTAIVGDDCRVCDLISVLIFVYNLFRSLKHGQVVTGNVWNSRSPNGTAFAGPTHNYDARSAWWASRMTMVCPDRVRGLGHT